MQTLKKMKNNKYSQCCIYKNGLFYLVRMIIDHLPSEMNLYSSLFKAQRWE